MHAWLLATLLLAANETPTQSTRPYRITVCLRTSDHPLMTPLFASSVRRQVEDHLKRLFGTLAVIDVRTKDHWLLDEQQRESLEQVRFPSPPPTAVATSTHTILIGIDYHDTEYVIRWRHVDESLQQLSAIQQRRTPDRQWVGKAVCLAIRDDFPVTATVVQKYSGEATLEFLTGPFSQTLQEVMGEACVFRVMQVQIRKGSIQRRPVPYTYLLWEREKGSQRATVISKDTEPLKPKPGVRYEAERLATTRGQLRLSLRDSKSLAPLQQCFVAVSDQGFDQITDRELQTPNRYGIVVSSAAQLLDRMAYVRIAQGSNSLKIPVPITSELTELEVRFANSPQGLAGEDLSRELKFISRDLQIAREIQQLARDRVNEAYGQKQYEEALRVVTDTVTSLMDLVQTIEQKLAEQRATVERTRELQDKRPDVERRERELTEVKSRQANLKEQQVALQQVIDTKNAKSRAQVFAASAAEAENEGDIDEAIAMYSDALKEYPDYPQLADKLAQLKQQWEIRDPAQRRARQFVYQTLAGTPAKPVDSPASESSPTDATESSTTEASSAESVPLDVHAFVELIPEAEKQFAVLEQFGDLFTAKKLYSVLSQRQNELADLLELLVERDSEDSRDELAKTNDAVKTLDGFSERVAEFIQRQADAAERAASAPANPDATSNPETNPNPAANSNPTAPGVTPDRPTTPANATPPASPANATDPNTQGEATGSAKPVPSTEPTDPLGTSNP